MVTKRLLLCFSLMTSIVGALAAPTSNSTTTSNGATSLQILYNNNLNSTDDVNHLAIILLDSTTAKQAPSACRQIGEESLDLQSIRTHSLDVSKLVAYLAYSGHYSRFFHVQNGTIELLAKNGTFSTHPATTSDEKFPVLCTQERGSDLPTSLNEISVKAGYNTFNGYRNKKSFVFLGIPYADSPARFTYPREYSGEGKLINTVQYPPQCAQASSGSEDCLYLNINTPYLPRQGNPSGLKPVLFWIHGGGFTGGNGQTDGSNLASREDIVFVSIQYRLSTLGFLAVPGTNITGNYGIADQITALKWVRHNIASFGGDPNKITIVGESAGAGSVRVLLGSQQAIGNFRGAISMSNLGGGMDLGLQSDYSTSYSSYLTTPQSYELSKGLFTDAGCTNATLDLQIACIKDTSALALVELPNVARYVVQDGKYVNTEQLVLSSRNASTAHVPVMFGVMADDGASVISYPRSPVTDKSTGIQAITGISQHYADLVMSSGLFPFANTGNLTLDTFNVSSRLYTDAGFRCVDQATVYAGALTGAFPSAYYYQFDRSIGGYDPNNVGNPPPSPGYPRGDPSLPYFKVHAGDVQPAFGAIAPDQIREPEDLWFVQLVSGYWAEFVRSLQPNPDPAYLTVRGYEQTLKAVSKSGLWQKVGKASTTGPIQRLDWPPQASSYLEVQQCQFLNYSLSYYIDSNRG